MSQVGRRRGHARCHRMRLPFRKRQAPPNTGKAKVKQKWRPSLGLVVATVLGLVLMLPLAGLFLFNFYGKQLVQQTEESLIAQTALLAAAFEDAFRENGGDPKIGFPLSETQMEARDRRLRPIFPSLSLSSSAIYPPRPDALRNTRPVARSFRGIGPRISRIARRAQSTTLAGYRIIDSFGLVIGGSAEIGFSLAHIEEVREALRGIPTSRLRTRDPEGETPPIWSISRRSAVRVFVAMPVVVDGHVVGAAYVSRTPGNVVQYLYLERANLLRTVIGVALAAMAIGFVFWRFVSRPIYGLIASTTAISQAAPDAIQPLPHYGTKEVARLGQSFLTMAEALEARAAAVQTFTAHVTHELKSPITSVAGAAELLRDQGDRMDPARQQKFLDNIASDANRMSHLLDQLRNLAAAREVAAPGETHLSEALNTLATAFPKLTIVNPTTDLAVPLPAENLGIVLTHLAQNAAEHDATTLTFKRLADERFDIVSVTDDGTGIKDDNSARIFDAFFTTRRDSGGTGMGLGIVSAILTAVDAEILHVPTETGARFDIRFPARV